MKFEDLKSLKRINGFVIALNENIKFKVKLLPTTKPVGDDWVDGEDAIRLVGNWRGRKIVSETIFNQRDFDSLQNNISLQLK